MPSRRAFLTGSATAVVLASKLGLARTFAAPGVPVDSFADVGRPVAALVAHAPGWLRDDALACPIGSGAIMRRLQADGLVALTIDTGADTFACGKAIQALRRQVGENRPLGLVCWDDVSTLPGMRALRSVVDAVALLDQLDALAPGNAPSVLYHFAKRRSPAARRAIALQLSAIEQTGRPVTCHWYDADPGFAAPDRSQADWAADLVWSRTTAFLKHHLDQRAPEPTMATGWLGG